MPLFSFMLKLFSSWKGTKGDRNPWQQAAEKENIDLLVSLNKILFLNGLDKRIICAGVQ